jgi:purine-cytosine permease-like protein
VVVEALSQVCGVAPGIVNASPSSRSTTSPGSSSRSRPQSTWTNSTSQAGANTFAIVILGTFPVLLGLDLVQAVAATVAGVVVGALILMPMGLFGPRTGTNNAVSSARTSASEAACWGRSCRC